MMKEDDANIEYSNNAANDVSLDDDLVYNCEFCGEANAVSFDMSAFSYARKQQFTEDCAVCCRPNLVTLEIDRDGFVSIDVQREYDA